jgi:hypothetical protein
VKNYDPAMALADDLRDCLTELLGSPPSEIPDASVEPIRFFRQWLAERNLGLAPIADAPSFDWPGQWIAIVDGPDGQHAVVSCSDRPWGSGSTPPARTGKGRSRPGGC